MKEQIKTMWKEICTKSIWRFGMFIEKQHGRGEVIDTCRTVISENINIIVSWFDSYGHIRYFNNKYPNINFVYPISHDEFKNLISLYETGENYDISKDEIKQLQELKLKYPHIQ